MGKRIFRVLVCLFLVCCILVNASPVRAEASLVVGSVITGTGLFATLFSMSMGVVFVDLTADLINGLGKSFENHVTSNVGTDESEILKVWIQPLQVDLDSGGISQLPPEQDDDNNNWAMLAGVLSIPDSLKDDFCDWGEQLIKDDGVQVDQEVVIPDGYADYGGVVMKTISLPDYPYSFICWKENFGKYYWFFSESQPYWKLSGGIYRYLSDTKWRYYTSEDGSSWSYGGTYLASNGALQYLESNGPPDDFGILWSGFDISNYDSSSSIMDGSDPSNVSTQKTTVTPSIYVGDIPSQVQDGSFDDDKYELPYINYTQLFQNQTDAIEALNNAATQLQNQTMTYQQYMDLIQSQTGSGTNPDLNPNPDPNPDPGTDPDDPEQDPEQDDDSISNFTLDLKDYFPFCIPFDLYDFVSCLNAAPEAPVIEWEIYTSGGGSYPLVLDLSPFDSAAQLLRRLELLLFCIGLGFVTRNLIKG